MRWRSGAPLAPVVQYLVQSQDHHSVQLVQSLLFLKLKGLGDSTHIYKSTEVHPVS